jgi:hypothetical protein
LEILGRRKKRNLSREVTNMLSAKFFQRLEKAGKPYYQIAWDAGLTPNQLYKFTSGIERPKPGDKRVAKVATVLGLKPEECFEEVCQ